MLFAGPMHARHRKTTRVNTLQNANAHKCSHEEGYGWGGVGGLQLRATAPEQDCRDGEMAAKKGRRKT
jgi:hypothetical protein